MKGVDAAGGTLSKVWARSPRGRSPPLGRSRPPTRGAIMARPSRHRRSALAEKGGVVGLGALLVLASGACFGRLGAYDSGSGSGSGSGGGAAHENFPFEAVSPRIYVAKVKDLLVGE